MAFKLTDGTNVYTEGINEPYMVIDDLGTLLKIGEKGMVTSYYEKTLQTYNSAGFFDEASSLMLVELPKDQEEIDKVFNITGYAKRYIPSSTNN